MYVYIIYIHKFVCCLRETNKPPQEKTPHMQIAVVLFAYVVFSQECLFPLKFAAICICGVFLRMFVPPSHLLLFACMVFS